MASTGVESLPQSAAGGKSQLTEVRVYPHSPILYWWVVWVYGFFCALLIYAGAWLGISFTLLLLFVALATTVKARGIAAILLILLLIGAAAGTQFIMNIDGLFKTPPAILVHMNL